MANEKEDLPAFPIQFEYHENALVKKTKTHFGLTKLEYFTAAAMQGLLANNREWDETIIESDDGKDWVAVQAVDYAVKTLERLESY